MGIPKIQVSSSFSYLGDKGVEINNNSNCSLAKDSVFRPSLSSLSFYSPSCFSHVSGGYNFHYSTIVSTPLSTSFTSGFGLKVLIFLFRNIKKNRFSDIILSFGDLIYPHGFSQTHNSSFSVSQSSRTPL